MRSQIESAGFQIRDWTNFSEPVIENSKKVLSAPPSPLAGQLVWGADAPERQRNSLQNLNDKRTIYWLITAQRPE